MAREEQIIVIAAVAAAALCAVVPFHFWNCRVSKLPIQVRAVADTTLHGLTPAVALAPLWLTGDTQPMRGLFIFLCGFLLDLDHVIAFRSVSLVRCSTQERRPFGHSVTFALLCSAAVGAVFWSAAAGAMCMYAFATHVLFDATDRSGIPALYPANLILRRVPFALYPCWLAFGLAASAIAAWQGWIRM